MELVREGDLPNKGTKIVKDGISSGVKGKYWNEKDVRMCNSLEPITFLVYSLGCAARIGGWSIILTIII
jgi:hypothetical protein